MRDDDDDNKNVEIQIFPKISSCSYAKKLNQACHDFTSHVSACKFVTRVGLGRMIWGKGKNSNEDLGV